MFSTYYGVGLCTWPLWCFANSCFKGVASFYLGGLSNLALFFYDCIFYFLNLRIVLFYLSLQVFVSIIL